MAERGRAGGRLDITNTSEHSSGSGEFPPTQKLGANVQFEPQFPAGAFKALIIKSQTWSCLLILQEAKPGVVSNQDLTVYHTLCITILCILLIIMSEPGRM